MQEKIPDSDLAGDGKDVDQPHVTVRYGLKTDLTPELRKFIESQSPFEAKLGPITAFPPSKSSDGAAPIVAPVISPELHRINAEIEKQGEFEPSSFPEYRPHVSVAYVKPELAKKYTGMKDAEGKTFPITSIAVTDKNGDHTEIPLKGESPSAAGQESSLESNTDSIGGAGIPEPVGGSTGTTPTTKNSKTYRDFEQYAAMNGASRQDYGDPALARSNSSVSQSSRDSALKNQSAKDSALTERRDALRQEYREKIASGEVREMTEGERLKEQADSNPESEATKAAQRILEKRAAFKASAVSVQGGTVIVGGSRQETAVPVKRDWVPREDTTNGGYRALVGTKRIGREGYVDVLTELPISSLVMPQGNNLYAQAIQKYQDAGDSDYPIVIPDERGNVVDDGNHRVEAARRAGKSSTMVWMRQPEHSTERTKDLEQWYKDNPSGAVRTPTSVPHQTTAQVSVPLQTAMGVTPVVTKRILPLSELKAMAAGMNPQRQVKSVRELMAMAKSKMVP
jgi:2'-5' RNA ligase